ncbi:MAG: ROK family protein [Patescibacteria group bacterium]
MIPAIAIAVDLGATNVRVALVDNEGKIIRRLSEKTSRDGKRGRVVTDQIIRLIRAFTSGISKSRIRGIGISSMGPLDLKRGGPYKSPNVPFTFIPLVDSLRKTFGLPVFLLNDANAGALAEHYFGKSRGKDNLVYITLSTGIGAGAIVNGRLLLGRSGNAAELGHLIVDTAYNLPCTCGKGTGHWEGLASGRNLPRFFAAWLQKTRQRSVAPVRDARNIFDSARGGNRLAGSFLEELARVNARALSDIIVAYEPERIALGGSVALQNAPLIIPGIKKHIDRYLRVPEISLTRFKDDVGLVGVAGAVLSNG